MHHNNLSISGITITNFKSICGEQRIDFRPITLLFGPNSAGKSTILQTLQFMQELLERRNVDPDRTIVGGESIDLGGFRNFAAHHDVSEPITVRVDFAPGDDPLPTYGQLSIDETADQDVRKDLAENGIGAVESAWVKISSQWDAETQKPWITAYEVGLNGQRIAEIATQQQTHLPSITFFDFDHPLFLRLDEMEGVKENDETGTRAELKSLAKDLIFDPEQLSPVSGDQMWLQMEFTPVPDFSRPLPITADLLDIEEQSTFELLLFLVNQVLVGTGALLLRELQGIRYLGPIRKVPPRNFMPQTSPDDSRWSSGLAAWDLLYASYDRDACSGDAFLKEVNRVVSSEDELGLGYSIELADCYELRDDSVVMNHLRMISAEGDSLNGELFIEPIRRELERLQPQRKLVLHDEVNDTDVKPQDIGVGISQVIPVIVGAMDPNCSIYAIEQPELHIHPRIQCNLGDTFAAQAGKDDGRVFLIETHSEHLILRLLRRIRETTDGELPPGKPPLTPDQVAVYYVEGGKNGMKVTEIPVASDGDFTKQWPQGFFEERAEELF